MFRVSISAVDPLVAADAPLASDNDNPAAPNTGTALPLRFRFEACFAGNMVESPIEFDQSIFSDVYVGRMTQRLNPSQPGACAAARVT